jgi:hypothetical protein
MPEPSSTPVCTAYRVTDQFGRVHERAAVAGRPALYVVATRQGAGLLAEWTRGLRALATAPATDGDAAAASPVAVIPVVTIPGVPTFLQGAVRRLLPREPEAWVLVDFDGAFAGLAASEASCTVTLVDGSGGVRTRAVVAHYEPETAAALLAAATRAP